MWLLREPPSRPARPIWRPQGNAAAHGPWRVFLAAVFGVFAVAGFARAALPGDLVVPVAASLLFVTAAMAALIAARAHRSEHTDRLTYWDVAGALTFIGIGLSTLIEGEELARLIEVVPRKD